jgi:hypothetical protein
MLATGQAQRASPKPFRRPWLRISHCNGLQTRSSIPGMPGSRTRKAEIWVGWSHQAFALSFWLIPTPNTGSARWKSQPGKSQNHFRLWRFPLKLGTTGGRLTLRVESERWCESILTPNPSLSQSACCGDVATSVCEACGVALCESHERVCPNCFGVNCRNCQHVCRLTTQSAWSKAA